MNAYLVTFELKDGTTASVNVIANNQNDAEIRAARKVETIYGPVDHLVRTVMAPR